MTVSPFARSGFTMIELLIVITIIGIVSAFALPRIDRDQFLVDAAAREVATELAYAARAAATMQHDVRVAVDTGGRRLRVHEDQNNDNVVDAGERVTWTALAQGAVFARGGATALPFGTSAINLTRTQDGMPLVVFRRDGSASESGGIYVTTARALAANRPTATRAIEIVGPTGRMLVQSFGTGAWRRGN